jgi:uncharacterized protein (TIGR03083 family)
VVNSAELVDDYVEGIAFHSAEMAVDAARNLHAPVAACPGWTVRDLVEHIGRVQWFWSEIVERRVQDRDEMNHVSYPSERGDPITWFGRQSKRLVTGLHTMADTDPLWSWWEPEQTALFAKRRQFNEVVMHAYDTRNAVGDPRPIPVRAALTGLDEFIAIMSKDICKDHPAPSPVRLRATDSDWTGVLFEEANERVGGSDETLELCGTASELLLTLWGRRLAPDPMVRTALAAVDLS